MTFVGRAGRRVAAAIFAAVIVAAGTSAGAAQQPQPPNVSAFLANPGQLLRQFPNGGQQLTAAVQQVVLSDPTLFNVLVGLLANANDVQKGSFGEGLAQAAKIEVLTNQPLATEWQQQIATITDPSFQTAATNAFGDVVLGAIGGGPLGATGGGGGGQTTPFNAGPATNGTPLPPAPTPVATQFFTITGTTGAAGSPPNNPPNNPPAINPVSQ